VSYEAVDESGRGDGGVPHGELLARLVEAMRAKESARLAAVRSEVIDTMGAAALVDAVAVSASFHMMNRVADGTGTPLDAFIEAPTEAIRAELGLDSFVSARHTSAR
jgi:hypothetical protein